MQDIFAPLFLLTIGVMLFGFGLATQLGWERSWYFAPNFMWRARLIPAIGIPAGLLFILPVIIGVLFPETPVWLRRGLGFSLVGLTFICAFLTPLLKPKWLRWLEREHSDILPLIEEEVNRIGCRKWTKQTRTQKELEQWVTEFKERIKYTKDYQEGTTLWEWSIPLPQNFFSQDRKKSKISDTYSLGTSVIVTMYDNQTQRGRIIGTPTINENGKPRSEPLPKRYTVKLENGTTVNCREENIRYGSNKNSEGK